MLMVVLSAILRKDEDRTLGPPSACVAVEQQLLITDKCWCIHPQQFWLPSEDISEENWSHSQAASDHGGRSWSQLHCRCWKHWHFQIRTHSSHLCKSQDCRWATSRPLWSVWWTWNCGIHTTSWRYDLWSNIEVWGSMGSNKAQTIITKVSDKWWCYCWSVV